MTRPRSSSSLSSSQRALLASLHVAVRHDACPGGQSIECPPVERDDALALSRRGYLVLNPEPNTARSFTVFLTPTGARAAMRLATPMRRKARAPRALIAEQFLRPMLAWPRQWAEDDVGIALGSALIGIFRHFLADLILRGAAPSTLRRHRDQLYTLGHECLRAIRHERHAADIEAIPLLIDEIDESGGPLLSSRFATEDDQRVFDATCRKLHRWLQARGGPDGPTPTPPASEHPAGPEPAHESPAG